MKKILFFGIAVIGIALASCSKDSFSPNSATTTLSNATAATDTTKKGGMPPKLDSVAISSLPAAITTYVATNYAGAEIKRAGKDKDGNFAVGILLNNQPKGLLFDSKGTFLKELPASPKGPRNHQGPPPSGGQRPDSIAISSLPNAIITYIAKNYAGAEIKRAGKDKDGNFIVGILANNQPKGLIFDSTGAFKEEAKLPPPPPKKG